MKSVTIEAEVPAKPEKGIPVALQGQVTVQFPETFDEAKSYCGEEAILSNALSNWTVTLQSNIRNGRKRGETNEQIQMRLGSAKPGIAAQGARVDPLQAFLGMFAASTPEKQAELLNELKKKAAGTPVAAAGKK